jgi:hypothetical protein
LDTDAFAIGKAWCDVAGERGAVGGLVVVRVARVSYVLSSSVLLRVVRRIGMGVESSDDEWVLTSNSG